MSTPSTLTEKSECDRHVFIGVECSHDVAFNLIRPCRNETRPICRALAQHIWTIQMKARCYHCRRRIVDHWITEPIR